MKNLKLNVISKYLRPYKKEFLYGAFALLVVNVLSVLIPLEGKITKWFLFRFCNFKIIVVNLISKLYGFN